MIQAIAMSAAGGALVGSLLAAWLMGEYKDATWTASVNQLKVEAADILAKETNRVITLERAAVARVRDLEAQHVQEEKTIHDVERRNRALAAQLGGLRDPGRRASRENAMPTTSTDADSAGDASAASNLSAEASEALLAAGAEVDRLAAWAHTCYEWKEAVVTMYAQRVDP